VDRLLPAQVPGLTGVKSIAGGAAHTIALKKDTTVWTWGNNVYGQLGTGGSSPSLVPLQVKGPGGVGFLTGVVAVAAGNYHSIALLNDGTVWAWGRNDDGELGLGDNFWRSTPVQVTTVSGVSGIVAGGTHTLALLGGGTVRAWGWNKFGQLGVGDNVSRAVPVSVTALSGVAALGAGDETSIAILGTGPTASLVAWGANNFGQLGSGSVSPYGSFPATVSLAGGAVLSASAGGLHTAILRDDGTVWSAGANQYGQLGIASFDPGGSPLPHPTPLQAVGEGGAGFLEEIRSVSAGYGHTVALDNTGTAWTWGFNDFGQLGDNTVVDRSSPVRLLGF
jgi:alpha-tubulin suppressor-like RCC1 family protein